MGCTHSHTTFTNPWQNKHSTYFYSTLLSANDRKLHNRYHKPSCVCETIKGNIARNKVKCMCVKTMFIHNIQFNRNKYYEYWPTFHSIIWNTHEKSMEFIAFKKFLLHFLSLFSVITTVVWQSSIAQYFWKIQKNENAWRSNIHVFMSNRRHLIDHLCFLNVCKKKKCINLGVFLYSEFEQFNAIKRKKLCILIIQWYMIPTRLFLVLI